MSSKFYDGHSMEWIERFKKAIPSNLHVGKGVLLAMTIHHLGTIKKRNIISLDREILKEFGVNPHRVKPYLLCFEKAGLIELSMKSRSITQLKILLLDPYHYVPKYKTKIREGTYKGIKETASERTQPYVRTDTDAMSERTQMKKPVEGKVGRIDSEGRVGRVGREDRKVGRVGRVGRIAGRVG